MLKSSFKTKIFIGQFLFLFCLFYLRPQKIGTRLKKYFQNRYFWLLTKRKIEATIAAQHTWIKSPLTQSKDRSYDCDWQKAEDKSNRQVNNRFVVVRCFCSHATFHINPVLLFSYQLINKNKIKTQRTTTLDYKSSWYFIFLFLVRFAYVEVVIL